MAENILKPRIWVGLGNPGEEYANTYHNVGKLFVEYLCEREGLALTTPSRKHFAYAKSKHGILVVPLTFMNTSGQPTREALHFFETDSESLVVVHDETDLAVGSYKYNLGGGTAGHHGLDSILETLGTPEFHRLRIGVRNPLEEIRQKAGDFVLRSITKADRVTLHGVFDEVIVKVIENETP